MTTLERPRQIIEFCLKPLGLDPQREDVRETTRRLEHAIKTLQLAALRSEAPIAVDFSKMPLITINEAAHGHE